MLTLSAGLLVISLTGGMAPALDVSSSLQLDPADRIVGRILEQRSEQEIEPIDINAATAEELNEVPGIGPVMAARIIEFRTEHGPFKRVDDLLDVSGIGVRSLERLRPYLTVKSEKRPGEGSH